MQRFRIILGGLEAGYMQRLALYLNERMAPAVQVELLSKGQENEWRSMDLRESGKKEEQRLYMGSREFIDAVQQEEPEVCAVILDEEQAEDEGHIFQYQSREVLYEKLRTRWRKQLCLPVSGSAGEGRRQKWLAVTTSGPVGTHLVFSMLCAELLGETERVLYLNFSECSGMTHYFAEAPRTELGDLILALRRGEKPDADQYVCAGERADYLFPPENPMILHELDAADTERLMGWIREAEQYDRVVFALGSTFCGCETIFAEAERVFHLTGQSPADLYSQEAWLSLIGRCRSSEAKAPEVILPPGFYGEEDPPEQLREWLQGEPGYMVRRQLMQGDVLYRRSEP